jgi:hypothetical protein
MSGWWIVVDPRTPAERDASDDRLSSLLASWETEVFNIQWLQALVSAGKAQQHSFSGYPNRFTAKASDILPVLLLLSHSHDENVANVTIHNERITKIVADHVLTIDVWDKS